MRKEVEPRQSRTARPGRGRGAGPIVVASAALVGLAALGAAAALPARRDGGRPARDPYEGLRPFAGDTHVHTGLAFYRVNDPEKPHSIGTPEQVLDAAESRGLDFVVLTDHSNNLNDPRGIRWRIEHDQLFTLPDGTRTPDEWANLEATVARRNRPGRFVVFLGIEYTRGTTETTQPGHKAAVLPTDDIPRWCSNFPQNGGDCPGGADFFRFVREHGGVAIQAHPCADWGFSDWSETDPVMNSMELYAGKCEFAKSGYNEVLGRGMKIGLRGGSDSHAFQVGNNDKTICWARDLTRESLLEAMRANLCYWVDRFPVTLKLAINGAPMGAVIEDDGAGLAVEASASTTWQNDFDHLELIHDGQVPERAECGPQGGHACALKTYLLSDAAGYYYAALGRKDGQRIAVSSPIWVEPEGRGPEGSR